MKRTVLAVAVLASMVLPSCTVFHPQRRQMTDWNFDIIKEHAVAICRAPENCEEWNPLAETVVDWVTVQPLAIAMLPLSILCDTLILNPIDAWKCAEMKVHHKRHDRHAEHSNAQAAHYDFQAKPPFVPPNAPSSDLLALPRFLGHWLWGATSCCSEPCPEGDWNEYWNEHKEETGY